MTINALRQGIMILEMLALANKPDFSFNLTERLNDGDPTTAEKVWLDALEDLSDVEFIKAIKTLSKTSKFFPAPAEIIQAARPQKMTALEAWQEVCREKDRCCGLPNTFPEFLSPEINDAVAAMGGLYEIWRQSENKSDYFIQKDFKRIYNQITSTKMITGGEVKELEETNDINDAKSNKNT